MKDYARAYQSYPHCGHRLPLHMIYVSITSGLSQHMLVLLLGQLIRILLLPVVVLVLTRSSNVTGLVDHRVRVIVFYDMLRPELMGLVATSTMMLLRN